MGRPRKSTALKALEGDAGRRGAGAAVPFVSAEVGPPEWLTGEVALREWNRVAAELQTAGRLSQVDQAALALYCDSLANYVAARDHVNKEGAVLTGPRGGIFQNPWSVLQHQAYLRFVRIATEFGLTTAARQKLSPAAPPMDAKRMKFFGPPAGA